MHRTCTLLAFVMALGLTVADDHSAPIAPGKKAPLFPAQGRHHHPIATSNAEAQVYFDQGMTLLINFNHAEAVRSFRQAAALDPMAVMPWWGIGYALGPNYNRNIDPVDAARNQAAYEAVQKGLALIGNHTPARERAYLRALAKRYALDPRATQDAEFTKKLETDYKEAMGTVTRAFPDDPDAAALYAEAIMNLRPWELWSHDYHPAEGTEEVVRVLEGVLARWPDHLYALHLHIHAVEASAHPERGLRSADRLLHLVPWAGHLTHMPCHIYLHTGDYELAAQANLLAIKADEAYLRDHPENATYRWMYYTHNIHFLATARAFQGRYDEAQAAADKLAAYCAPQLEHMPMLETFLQIPLQIQIRFHRWDEILALPQPPEQRQLSRAFWHYGRCLAFRAKGQPAAGEKEQAAFESIRRQIPGDAVYAWNLVKDVLQVASEVLQARLATTPQAAIERWQKAVALEDALKYGEPADWYYPLRESLGAALLQNRQYDAAEKVFREDLRRNRRNGRSLFGLLESLKAQGNDDDAAWVKLELEQAWNKGVPLRLGDL
jgi:Flp pilus assembly protein TadD